MNIYLKLFLIGIVSIAFQAYLSFQVFSVFTSFLFTLFIIVFALLMTFAETKDWMEKKFEKEIQETKKKYNMIVQMTKSEYDTAALEKAIREGTRTLIKNAVDYFKLENIKKEIGSSAACDNLKLDKYMQIIELLTDFSFILPVYEDNMNIVKQEFEHQIAIYQVDQRDFSIFLQRIMTSYIITVEKVKQEKLEQIPLENLKICPRCAEKVFNNITACKHCGYQFKSIPQTHAHAAIALDRAEKGQRLYDSGNYDEALHVLNDAIKLMPNYSKAYYIRALINYKLKDNKQAEKDLKEAAYLGDKRAKFLLSPSEKNKIP